MEKTRIKSSATSGDLIFKFPFPSMIPDQDFDPAINRYPQLTNIRTYYYLWVNLTNDLNSHHQRINGILCDNYGGGGCLLYPADFNNPGIVQSRELYNTNSFFQIRMKFEQASSNAMYLFIEDKQSERVKNLLIL